MESFRVVGNDGSHDSDVVAIVKGRGLHIGLTMSEAYRLRDALDRKIRTVEAAGWLKKSRALKRLRAKADAGVLWTQRDAATWRKYTSAAFPESAVVRPSTRRAAQKAEDGRPE